jgi:hypothetical protein
MMINLLPKEKQSKPQVNSIPNNIVVLVGLAIIIFSLCFYMGYLYYDITLHETELEQINFEMKCYSTPYRKVKNLETELNRIQDKISLKQNVDADYLIPLNALTSLIQLKPELNWFERIEFNALDGGFTVTGGAINYKALAEFIGKLEQDKASFTQIKPEQAMVYDNWAGREYVQFKISGILVKRSGTGVQDN